jgi:hypothetical protein
MIMIIKEATEEDNMFICRKWFWHGLLIKVKLRRPAIIGPSAKGFGPLKYIVRSSIIDLCV